MLEGARTFRRSGGENGGRELRLRERVVWNAKLLTSSTSSFCSPSLLSPSRNNDFLIVTLDPASSLCLILGQKDRRGSVNREGGESLSYAEIGITVVEMRKEKFGGGKKKRGDPFVFKMCTPENFAVFKKTRSFANKRDCSLRIDEGDVKEKGTAVGIAFSTHAPGVEGEFWCELRSSRKEDLEAVEWTAPATGGRERRWEGGVGKSLEVDGLKGVGGEGIKRTKIAIFIKEKTQKGEKGGEPLGCWVLGKEGGREGEGECTYKVLKKAEFVKSTESSILFDMRECSPETTGIVLCPAQFNKGKRVNVEVEVRVEGEEGGEGAQGAQGAEEVVRLVELENSVDPVKICERNESGDGATEAGRRVKKMDGGGKGGKGGRGGKGSRGGIGGGRGRGGGRVPTSMGAAKKGLDSVTNLYAGLE